MIINAPKVNIATVYAGLAFALIVQVCSLLYVQTHPDFAADAIMARSPLGYALLYDLRVFRWDDESDLTRAGLSRDAVIWACRFRAEVGIQFIEIAAVFIAIIAAGHYAAFYRRS